MALWDLTRPVGSGTVNPEVGDTYKLIRIRATAETELGSYTIPDLPYKENTLKFHINTQVTSTVERNDLTAQERNAIDADKPTQFIKRAE